MNINKPVGSCADKAHSKPPRRYIAPIGQLARDSGYSLPLRVLKSAAGFYLGTADEEGPVSRESVEYWPIERLAQLALEGSEGETWTQREHP